MNKTIVAYVLYEQITNSMINNSYHYISNEEKLLINNIKDNQVRYLSLVGRALIRVLIMKHFDIDYVKLKYNEFGKPYIDNENIFFNISHSNNLLTIIISNKSDVGIDIEYIKEFNNNVADFIMTSNEKDKLKTDKNKNLLFTKIWTRKEAYFKCKGTGITENINQVSLENSKSNFIQEINSEYFYFKSLIKYNYAISICTKNNIQVKIIKNKSIIKLLL